MFPTVPSATSPSEIVHFWSGGNYQIAALRLHPIILTLFEIDGLSRMMISSFSSDWAFAKPGDILVIEGLEERLRFPPICFTGDA